MKHWRVVHLFQRRAGEKLPSLPQERRAVCAGQFASQGCAASLKVRTRTSFWARTSPMKAWEPVGTDATRSTCSKKDIAEPRKTIPRRRGVGQVPHLCRNWCRRSCFGSCALDVPMCTWKTRGHHCLHVCHCSVHANRHILELGEYRALRVCAFTVPCPFVVHAVAKVVETWAHPLRETCWARKTTMDNASDCEAARPANVSLLGPKLHVSLLKACPDVVGKVKWFGESFQHVAFDGMAYRTIHGLDPLRTVEARSVSGA